MKKHFSEKYVENIPIYFKDKKEDNRRLFVTYNRLLKFLKLEEISKGKKILDLGSADGSFSSVCKDNGLEAFELDAFSSNINFENDEFPFSNEQFDFITLTSLIEHIKDPKVFIN